MISSKMRNYNYFTYGELNSYGQPQLSEEIQGTVKMTITLTSQAIHDSIKYTNATYLGLTHDSNINDSYVIQYGDKKLKVLYINASGRMKQVFMGEM